MTQKMKTILGAAAFVLFIAGAMLIYNVLSGSIKPENPLAPVTKSNTEYEEQTNTAQSEMEQLKAPNFTVEDADGNNVMLSDFEGKPVVLNFWASWCSPCKNEMAEFDKVYADIGGEVEFMMINMTDGQWETKETGASYISEQGFSFPVYYDTMQEGDYAFGIRSLPTTIFIDSGGYIITGAEGQINEAILRYGISMIKTNNSRNDMYRKITAEEAYNMMNNTDEFILLDVRTDAEFRESRISGAVLIPDYEITEKAEEKLPDKDALILVYCRSGRRSELAANKLVEMGYKNVYDFGGIVDWIYETEH